MPVIQVHQLKKTYSETEVPVHAVNGIDLSFEKGEFTAIVGPSGSGKTTLLNMIGGLEKPTSGRVEIDGTDISTLKPGDLIDFRLNNIGFVFQAYNLIPVLTAAENVSFIMQLQNRSKQEIETRTRQILESVGLGNRMKSKPNQLSGGQQQRVAVARALASKPKFILADEPTANLDSKSTTKLLDIMEKLNREEHMTFIFSTHDQRVVDKAHRVITIDDGKVTSDEIRQRTSPANKSPESKMEILRGDITKIQAGAIVNAANSGLRGGGGVDGAIHKAGGPTIMEECRLIVQKQGECPAGEAVITSAGALQADYVIHAVGPVWQGGKKGEENLLKQAYLNSLRIAEENGVKNIAFPNISTGVYHFPKPLAAKIAVDAVKEYLQHSGIEKVQFVCFDDENYQIYRKIL